MADGGFWGSRKERELILNLDYDDQVVGVEGVLTVQPLVKKLPLAI